MPQNDIPVERNRRQRWSAPRLRQLSGSADISSGIGASIDFIFSTPS
jgi:hypothetical protein